MYYLLRRPWRIGWTEDCSFWFYSLALCLCPLLVLSSVCLVFLCRPSVGPSARQIIGGLIVPANSNLVPSRLSLRPERTFVCLFVFFRYFVLFSSLFVSFLLFLLSSFFVCRCHGHVSGNIWMQVTWNDIPQLVNTVPLPTGIIVVQVL